VQRTLQSAMSLAWRKDIQMAQKMVDGKAVK
jgi:hypothetical protein